MSEYLVTGATGFIGSHLCRRLLGAGHTVYGTCRITGPEKIENILANPDFKLLECDITDFEAVHDLMRDHRFDAVFHTAAYIPRMPAADPFHVFDVNVRGTLNILHASYLKNVRKIIYSSSMSVYGNPQYLPVDERHRTEPVSHYGLTKLMGEMFCELYAQQYNLNIVILRYSGVFGPYKNSGAISNFIDSALRNKSPVISGDGTDVWDTIYVSDAVTANLLALDYKNEKGIDVFNIGRGEGVNVTDIANRIVSLCGSTAKPVIGIGTEHGGIQFFYNISKAEEVLGFMPTSLENNLKEFIEWKKS